MTRLGFSTTEKIKTRRSNFNRYRVRNSNGYDDIISIKISSLLSLLGLQLAGCLDVCGGVEPYDDSPL